jgi:hypothetical protein
MSSNKICCILPRKTPRPLSHITPFLIQIVPPEIIHALLRHVFTPTLLHLRRRAPKANKHSRIIRSKMIQNNQLMVREPSWHEDRTQRYQRNDQNRKPDSRDGLRNSNCTRDAEDLYTDEEPDFRPRNGIKWV